MSTINQPQQRLDVFGLAGGPAAAMVRVEERIELDATIRHLVKLRASFVNGCAYCVDMHWTHAREDGEPEMRLAQIATWHESPFFSGRERAALALTDSVTDVGETHVPDDVWEAAAAHFDERELANLLLQIAMINAWNRLAVANRTLPASFEGQQAAA